MKKITLLLSLLFMATGAGAKVITTSPVAGTAYKMKCYATDHPGYLADDGTTLQGRASVGTDFVLESNGTDGQYYLKSQVSNKYVNAAGVTNGSAVTFDATPTTYWTLDQTNVASGSNSWALRPNGTAGVSLNNNGAAGAACPYMKINAHSATTQNCNFWSFDDNVFESYGQPKFGGTVWTWNTETNVFDAEGQTSTATPGRLDNKGPLYKFENVGSVTTAVSTTTNTSDKGGIWVIGSSSVVTSSIGQWAGSILVEEAASAIVSYGNQLKGDEATTDATVWTNGTLTIAGGRTNFDMNDGTGQRWYIGEKGVINTGFTSVTRGNRLWDLQVVVADQPAREGVERVQTTLSKKVMTWGSNISNHINSITVHYKDASGDLIQLEESAVKYDNTGITIVYEGLGYDEKVPALPEGYYIKVESAKADFLTPATAADDNSHWYLLTQTRSGESPVYDNGSRTLYRAAAGTNINGQLISGNEQYLVRFFENGEGKYEIQFATGNFVTNDLNTGHYDERGVFNLYNINDEATHIGWNKADFANIVDNNGAGADLSYWNTGRVTNSGGNNDWSLYHVEFIDGVTIEYTIHSDVLDVDYTGNYVTGWDGDNTVLPSFVGAAGYTLSNVVFTQSAGTYTLAATINFPFPVSGGTVENATGIESALGNSKWYATADDKIKANNAANTTLNYDTQDQFKWYIYPSFADGVFSLRIKHFNGKYIPAITTAQNANTESSLTDETSAGNYYFIPCVGSGNGFCNAQNGSVFLSINTSGTNQNIYGWNKPAGAGHQGSNLTFPDVTMTEEQVLEQFAALKNAEKFDILEGSTVEGPGEIANPTEINAAIDAAQQVDENDIDAILAFISSDDGTMIQDYLDNVAAYGSLHTCHLTITKEYSTLMIPCPSHIPEGMVVSTVSADVAGTLTLTSVSDIVQNVPYVIESTVGNKYTIIGWLKNHPESTYTTGWLTGVYSEEGATVPEGSYVLGEDSERQAFVKSDGAATCNQYECYLTPVGVTEAADAYFFANVGTVNIDEITVGNNGKDVIYDLQGRRVSKAVKGVYIVNGKKILVK